MTRPRKNIIGPQVRKLLLERNLTLHQLAVELALRGVFVSADTLNRNELQREFVGGIELAALAAVFQIGVDHLFPPDTPPTELAELLRAMQKNSAFDRFEEQEKAN